jgi:transposase-like protein
MKVAPFHSVHPSARRVYHDNDRCTEGNNIETYYKRSGTGSRPRCDHCNRLA